MLVEVCTPHYKTSYYLQVQIRQKLSITIKKTSFFICRFFSNTCNALNGKCKSIVVYSYENNEHCELKKLVENNNKQTFQNGACA